VKRFALLLILIIEGLTMPKARAAEPVFLFEADPTLLTTTIRIVFTTGTSSDPKGKGGVANLVSELVMRGTKKHSRNEFQTVLERMGAAFDCSASHDKIIYSGEVIKENTEAFFKLIHEALTQPAFAKKEFDSLKKETLAEINHVKNSNGALAGLALRRLIFENTPMEKSGAGSLTSIKKIELKDLVAYYKAYFTQANMVIGVSGPLPEAALRAQLGKLAGALPQGTKPERSSFDLTLPKVPTLVVVDKGGTATGTVFMGQGGITAQDPDRFAMDVGNFSFGGEPLVSRLFRIVRGELGYTYSVSATYSVLGALSYQKGVYAMVSTPSLEFTTKTIRKCLEMWDEYMNKGVNSDELKLAHESVVNSYPFDFESADKRLSKRLYGEIYGVPVLSPEAFKKTIESVNNDRIKRALAERQTPGGWWITLVADADVIEKQLEAEQKDIPEKDRLKIARRFTPEELIR
jgi:zinc protease